MQVTQGDQGVGPSVCCDQLKWWCVETEPKRYLTVQVSNGCGGGRRGGESGSGQKRERRENQNTDELTLFYLVHMHSLLDLGTFMLDMHVQSSSSSWIQSKPQPGRGV